MRTTYGLLEPSIWSSKNRDKMKNLSMGNKGTKHCLGEWKRWKFSLFQRDCRWTVGLESERVSIHFVMLLCLEKSDGFCWESESWWAYIQRSWFWLVDQNVKRQAAKNVCGHNQLSFFSWRSFFARWRFAKNWFHLFQRWGRARYCRRVRSFPSLKDQLRPAMPVSYTHLTLPTT